MNINELVVSDHVEMEDTSTTNSTHSVNVSPPSPQSLHAVDTSDTASTDAVLNTAANTPIMIPNQSADELMINDMDTPQLHAHLPNLNDLVVEDYAEFRWHIPSLTALRKNTATYSNDPNSRKEFSPAFECAGALWRIMMFPNGNNTDSLSLYLEHYDPNGRPSTPDTLDGIVNNSTPSPIAAGNGTVPVVNTTEEDKKVTEQWHKCLQFAFKVQNPNDATTSYTQEAKHRFDNHNTDYGFSQFIRLTDLSRPSQRGGRSILENDSMDIIVYVRSVIDPVGTLWHSFSDWDSRRETGYVGLKNQGATCYMNSLLQSLYFTNTFRKAVFQIPTGDNDDDSRKALTIALQRLFYQLQHSPGAGDTRELTKSFGWDSVEAFMQHDVQEFNRVLQDSLEIRMKKTVAEGSIERCFVGKMKSYIKCVNVEYESAREETFYDIQLNVKGKRNLQESFEDYIQVEMLDGENKYQSEMYGLQDAKKGVIFTSFPPVLHLQLKRFEYDFERDAMVKINDRHEYPNKIDLYPYLDESVRDQSPQIYRLHGVLVHMGDVNGGHYCAFIRPEKDGKWYKFDDDKVIPMSEKEVMEDNYGGDYPKSQIYSARERQFKRFTSAYMLVYIRESDIDAILAPLVESDIPSHLRESIENDNRKREAMRKEAEERHLFMNIQMLRKEDLVHYQGFDLFDGDRTMLPLALRTRKDETFVKFKETVAKNMSIPPECMRLWIFHKRQNNTLRPDRPLGEESNAMAMAHIASSTTIARGSVDLVLYCETTDHQVADNNKQLVWFPKPTQDVVDLWIKYYDPATQTLEFLGQIRSRLSTKAEDIVSTLRELKNIPSDMKIRIWEEIKPGMVEPVKLKATLSSAEISTGDILCFQKDIPKEADENAYPYPSAQSYYDLLANSLWMKFLPRHMPADDKEAERMKNNGLPFEEFTLLVNTKFMYDEFSALVGRRLGMKGDQHLKLLFSISPSNRDKPSMQVKRQPGQTLHQYITGNYFATSSPVFWYEKMDISVVELETKNRMNITFVDSNNREAETVEVLVPKNGIVADLAKAANEKLSLNLPLDRLRICEVSNHRSVYEYAMDTSLSIMRNAYGNILTIEEVHPSEKLAAPEDAMVLAYHYIRDPIHAHSFPFKFLIKPGETALDMKKRLQARLGMGDKEFSKVKVSIHTGSNDPRPIDRVDTIVFDEWKEHDLLALEHPDRVSAKKHGGMEKSIKINN